MIWIVVDDQKDDVTKRRFVKVDGEEQLKSMMVIGAIVAILGLLIWYGVGAITAPGE